MTSERFKDPTLLRAQKLALFLGSCAVALLILCLALWYRRPPQVDLQDQSIRSELARQLAIDVGNVFDSFPDPDVGRVLQANMDGSVVAYGHSYSTNRFGMREREYSWPKKEGVTRIVLLGDSMVEGLGAAAEDRLGVVLEQNLRDSTNSSGGEIECLHLGVSSWNITAACAFVRRQLSSLDPDLVIHIVVPNDLDDSFSVRGFGAMSDFSSQTREYADAIVSLQWPWMSFGALHSSPLALGLDYESRSRYKLASEDINALATAIVEQGGEYILLGHWAALNVPLFEHLASKLSAGRSYFIPTSLANDPDTWISESNHHWNRTGHQRMGELLYGLVLHRNLLPNLSLRSDEEDEEKVQYARDVFSMGDAEARNARNFIKALSFLKCPSALTLPNPSDEAARMVHGGIRADGSMAPYASVMLKRVGGYLSIRGSYPIGSGHQRWPIQVHVDEFMIDSIDELERGSKSVIERKWKLPSELGSRDIVTVRFQARDWTYQGVDLRRCTTFMLEQVAITHE